MAGFRFGNEFLETSSLTVSRSGNARKLTERWVQVNELRELRGQALG